MQATGFSPCTELREVLLPAYAPSRHLADECQHGARWDPGKGHIPRGFVGALGSLDEVELVLVLAEPGNPLAGETYQGGDPGELLDRCAEKVYRIFEQRHGALHRNVRGILDDCFPGHDFYDQMRRTWITESYLCSRVSGRPVRTTCWRQCAGDYLKPQLELLKDGKIVPLGRDAETRVRWCGITSFLPGIWHPSPRRLGEARTSWKKIPQYLHGH
jgi:hypothetical protein